MTRGSLCPECASRNLRANPHDKNTLLCDACGQVITRTPDPDRDLIAQARRAATAGAQRLADRIANGTYRKDPDQ